MTERTLQGIAAAEGIAIGPAFCYRPVDLIIPNRQPQSPDAEWARFESAQAQAKQQIESLKEGVLARADQHSAAIFDAHMLMLADPMLHDAVKGRVNNNQIVESALEYSIHELAAMLAGLQDELFAARAVDVRDVGRRLLRILLGASDTSLDRLEQPSIIVAADLTPSDTASLRPDLTLGFCTAAGGLTSHTAILARTLGIPAVVGLGNDAIKFLTDGLPLVLDGGTGSVILSPSPDTQKRFADSRSKQEARFIASQQAALIDAVTKDGKPVDVGANIGEAESAREAVQMGAQGVGLLRTEFLYLQDSRPPSEAHQMAAYQSIFEAMQGRPVIVRTLDIGGDKPPSFLEFPPEMNPFLGWRAIRISIDRPDLFKTQLRAILRAGVGYRPLIMFPMISSVDELRAAQATLAECRAELDAEKLDYARDVPVGIMVETPGAAMLAADLIRECDFLSIGTNDLTQYTLAVDRTNERVASLYQPLHPAVLRLIKHTIDAAHAHSKWVGMCGELAGMPRALPILLGMGLDEFSMVPRAIPEAKRLLSQLDTTHAQEIAAQALSLSTTNEIESLMRTVLETLGA